MLDSVYHYINQFVHLTPSEFSAFSELAQVRHFDRRVKLIEVGEIETHLNFICKGLIRKYFYRQGEEVITQIAKEDELICSSVSFLSGIPSDYSVETIEPSTVISLSRNNMEKLYSMGPKMERMGRLVTIDWLLRKECWEHTRIQYGPKERFLKFVTDHPHLISRVPQKYLASYLNMKPETFSRYKRLIADGELVNETSKIAI
jgi:CRP-like cAMP-binding protein